jgi:hypothetical protein
MGFDASGNLYVPTGNGTFDGVTGFGESLVKLAPSSLSVLDFFAPSAYNTLNANDLDFGSAGPSLVPGTNLIIQGGKTGIIYLLNTSSLGHEVSGDVQIPQFFQAVDLTVRSGTHHIHNASPFWNSPGGLNLYVWGENDYLHQYQFNTSTQTFNTTPTATGAILPPAGMPGGMMVLSANASQSGTGIVWASVPRNGNANQLSVPGNLYAFNAQSLGLLWSSTAPGNDLLNFSKGSAPVVANGKVYTGSLSRFVSVYGLTTSSPAPQDLALNHTATSSTPCSSSETAAQAVDGSFATAPWCSSVTSPWLMVDLGAVYTISRFVVEHAGAGGEAFSLNTAAYNIQVSTDGVNFTTVVNVTGNVDSITTNDITPIAARFVQLNIITPTQTTSTTANIYEFQVFAPLNASAADFSISATPASQSLSAGFGASYTATAVALNGFNSSVVLSASGLPAGATASFSPASLNGSGDSTVIIQTTSSTPVGTYTFTLTGTSGGLQNSTSLTLVVNPISSGDLPVNLSSVYNHSNGIVNDGTTFTVGLDQQGNAYSANLLGSAVSFEGASFALGPPNAPDFVSNATVALPVGQYSTLAMLATGVNGNQASQTFTVTYTDGTTSTFTQSLSDWHTPENYAGESQAVTMAYRDNSAGTKNSQAFYLYEYSFTLNGAKTVSSVTLPGNTNVVVLAMTLTATAASPNFSIAATPASQTVTAGSGTSYTATIGALNGFAGTVTLAASGLPTGATAGFSPASVTGSGASTVSVATTSATPAGSYTVTLTGTSGTLQQSTTVTLNVGSFSIAATPASQTVTAGGSTSYTATIGALNGFAGTVTLAASGLPTGATAGFSPASVAGSGASTLSVATTSATPAGSYTVTLTGTSGTLQQSTTVTLVVGSAGSTALPVSLSAAYNFSNGIVTDGTTFAGGLDKVGNAYSANLLGSTVSFGGVSFTLGPPNAPDFVTNATVALPAGQYLTLAMLATGVNGNQASQTFTVTYTDGTTSTFTQSLSDWHTPENYAGESQAVTMAYRNTGAGGKDDRTFYLYEYSFALNATKTVSSITLPGNNNVVVLAMTLTP